MQSNGIIFNYPNLFGIFSTIMETYLDRIIKITQIESVTIGALERKIGASKGVLSRAIQNKTDIQTKWMISIIENYPHISAEWLLTGEGEMLKEEGEMGSNGKEEETEREQIERLSKEVGIWQTRYEELKKKRAPEAEDAGCAGAAV